MNISIDDLPKLTHAYNKAVKENKEIIIYKEEEILVSYLKYLIEYLNLYKKQ